MTVPFPVLALVTAPVSRPRSSGLRTSCAISSLSSSGNLRKFARKTGKTLNTLNKEQMKAEFKATKYRHAGDSRAADSFQKAAGGSAKAQKAIVSKMLSSETGRYTIRSKQARRVASKGKAYLDAKRRGSIIESTLNSPYSEYNPGIRIGTKYKVKSVK